MDWSRSTIAVRSEVSALLTIRSRRDQMSAIERRIADFVLDNAALLRDYSSQQLANALGVSQSSVVKFCQKLGFKGYPDLKYSIGEAVARTSNGEEPATSTAPEHPADAMAAELWGRKSAAEEETRSINPPGTIAAVAAAISAAGEDGTVFLIGLGADDIRARDFALRLSLLGILTVHNFDPAHMAASVNAARTGDVLVVFSEHGKPPPLCYIARCFREREGTVVSITRHTANPLRAYADIALVVSAHDDQVHIQPLLYQAAAQHLVDRVFVRLCEGGRDQQLRENLERLQHMLEP